MENVTAHEAFLCLGSNVGDRRAELLGAEQALTEKGVTIDTRSSIYETEPVGLEDQSWFLNRVVRVQTDRDPLDLLTVCKDVERAAGRVPTVRNGPRVLDIDILLYDELTFDSPRLTVPHPSMHARRFVLIPLLEIAADVTEPSTGTKYADILNRLDEGKQVLKSIPNGS